MIDVALLVHSLPSLLRGACVSIAIAVAACSIGVLLGTLIGLSSLSHSKWIRVPVALFVTFFRGTPMLIQIMFVFYVLPQIGISLPGFWCAVVAIGLNSAAYMSQTIRAGINAVPKGQLEAAKVLGMTKWQGFRYVLLPQVFRLALPSLGNEFITLVKDSSLASIIGVMELSKEGSIIRSQTYDAFTVLLAVACIYLVITSILSLGLKFVEKRSNQYVRT